MKPPPLSACPPLCASGDMKPPPLSACPPLCASGDMSPCQSEPARLHSPALDITCQLRGISTIPVKRGGFSDIYRGLWISGDTRLKVALKVVHATSRDARTRRRLEREISIWRRLSHPNVHDLCGLYERPGNLPAMVSPWCSNGDINEYIKLHANSPSLALLKLDLLGQAVCGLKYLHDKKVVHADLKGGNVLVSDEGVARLCDFGLSALRTEPSTFTTTAAIVGTYRWMAPELILDDNARHSYESDIWACGCLMIEVQSATPPYHHLKSDRHVILALSRHEIPLQPESMPEFLWLLVLVCCKIDPAERVPVSVLHALLEAEFYTRGGCRKARFPDLVEWSGRPRSLDFHKPAPQLRHIAQNLRSRLLYWPQSRREWNQHHYFTPSTLRSLAHVLSEPMEYLMSTFGSACVGTLLDHQEPVRCVAWFPTGGRIAFGARTVSVIEVATGKILWTANHPQRNVTAIAISPTGRVVASCTLDCWIRLWDATSGQALQVLRGHTHLVSSISFSPDGSMLASGSEDRTIRFWSTATGETALAPIVYDYSITSVAFSPDGARLASTSTDGSVSLWDPLTGEKLMNALDPDEDEIGPLYRLAFSPDGRRVVTTGMDKALRLWDTSSGQLSRAPVRGHWQRITCVAYSPNGTRIASSSEDESVRLWDAQTGEVVGRPLVGHCDTVYSVAFSPDGRWLASASDDGTLRLWDATDSWLRMERDS